MSVYAALPDYNWTYWRDMSLGTALAALLAVLYAVATATVAAMRAPGPKLWVADAPTGGILRVLRVENRGRGEMQPEAHLTAVVDASGESLTGWVPLELRWFNRPAGERPRVLSRRDAAIEIFTPTPNGDIMFCGHPNPIPITPGHSPVFVHIVVDVASPRMSEERWFRIDDRLKVGWADFQVVRVPPPPPSAL